MSLRYLGGIIKPSYNPLAANVTTSPTVVQTGGVYTLQQQAQAQGQQQWSHDPYFNNTTLLLHADNFANGSQNNTFLNTPPGGVGQYAGSFNGSSQYLTAAASANLALGAGDFTVEFWAYLTANPSGAMIASVRLSNGGANGTWGIYSNNGGKWNFTEVVVSPTTSVSSNTAPVLNTWTHVAIVRSGTTLSIYLNGVSDATGTSSTNFNNLSYPLRVMWDSYTTYTGGYLSNLRIVKGTAVYTSNFTPPTSPLTAITNTQLLTCQSATFVDNSPNNFTITNNGTATIVNPNSFPAITRNGTPTQGTFTPYGDVWSNYFNGSSDSLTTPSSAALNFGTGSFTAELWVYHNASGASEAYCDQSNNGFSLSKDTNDKLALAQASVAGLLTSTASIPIRQWVHVAVVRNGSTVTMYINGIASGSATVTNNFNASSAMRIGRNFVSGISYMNGFMSNLRLVAGTAVYTSNFNPSTTPLTAVTNTSLLTCQSNRFIDNSANNFTITANGTPTVQRFAPFSPSSGYAPSVYGGSGYFNAADYLSTASGMPSGQGTAFTVELFVYLRDVSAFNVLFSGPSGALHLAVGSGAYQGQLRLDNNAVTNIIATATNLVVANQWYHIAVTRTTGNVYTIYLNGTSVGSATYTTSMVQSNSIGGGSTVSSTEGTKGYITDFRCVSSLVYTANFTPPSAPLTSVANTSLLTSFTNAGVYDNGMQNNLTTVGNAQVSTSVVKYGSGSMYFDGSGDWLSSPTTASMAIAASAPFTVECWVYLTAAQADYRMIASDTGAVSPTYVSINSTGVEAQFGGSTATRASCSYTFSTGVWYHLAVVRSSGDAVVIYVNGVAQSMTNGTQSGAFFNQGSTFYVGRFGGATAYEWNGYIDDFRITKGVARYLSNFTPPKVAMANQ